MLNETKLWITMNGYNGIIWMANIGYYTEETV